MFLGQKTAYFEKYFLLLLHFFSADPIIDQSRFFITTQRE